MLKKIREYISENPLQGWFCMVGFLTVVHLLLFMIGSRSHNWFNVSMAVGQIFGMPTFFLMLRLSQNKTDNTPSSPRQEIGFAVLSLIALISSVAAEAALLLCTRHGLLLTNSQSLSMIFSCAGLLAIAFGAIAQRTRLGRYALIASCVWLAMIIIVGLIKLFSNRS